MADIPEGDKDLWGSPIEAFKSKPDLASAIATLVCGFSAVSLSCANADELADLYGDIQTQVSALLKSHGINT